MSKRDLTTAVAALGVCAGSALATDWVEFDDQTSSRIVHREVNGVPQTQFGVNDPEEKDYIWGDLDNDGDDDLVVGRKLIGSNSTGMSNVLFMNERGVLVDRTIEFATAADDGGQGFLDITADRDVALVDVNNDGWLDVITASSGAYASLPKTISHPRIYINLGEDNGVWQGLRYEEARIPEFVQPPNYCAIAWGDVDEDGDTDLYFSDYRNELEDRIIMNDGAGNFVDETAARLSTDLTLANFSPHAVIADYNNDGHVDILKISSLGLYDQRLSYNDPNNVGFFPSNRVDSISNGSVYFISVGDLNNDGLLDVVEGDDGTDRYKINTGNGPDGQATFNAGGNFPNSGGFPGNTLIADLDNDGNPDVLIADVDVDLPSCTGNRLKVQRSSGGNNPTFTEDPGNLPTGTSSGSPLAGTHDVAAMDLKR